MDLPVGSHAYRSPASTVIPREESSPRMHLRDYGLIVLLEIIAIIAAAVGIFLYLSLGGSL